MKALLARLAGLRLYHFWLPCSLIWLTVPLYHNLRSEWIWFTVVWTLFVMLYFLAHSVRKSPAIAAMVGLCVLAMIYLPRNPAAAGMFGFCGATMAARNPKVAVLYGFLTAVGLLLVAECFLFHLSAWTWVCGTIGAILFSTYVLFETRQDDANTRLRQAHKEIGRLAKLAERERITRDLHDVIGHTLSLVAMKSELAQKIFNEEPERTLSEARDIEKITRQALVRVRETIHGYRNAQFRGELDEIVKSFSSLGVEVAVSIEDIPLSVLQESVLAMVLQEAATNVIRHAHASKCEVRVFSNGETINLVVHDDGEGSEHLDGFGIRGMRARLEVLGGDLELTSRGGTRLHAKLPRQGPAVLI